MEGLNSDMTFSPADMEGLDFNNAPPGLSSTLRAHPPPPTSTPYLQGNLPMFSSGIFTTGMADLPDYTSALAHGENIGDLGAALGNACNNGSSVPAGSADSLNYGHSAMSNMLLLPPVSDQHAMPEMTNQMPPSVGGATGRMYPHERRLASHASSLGSSMVQTGMGSAPPRGRPVMHNPNIPTSREVPQNASVPLMNPTGASSSSSPTNTVIIAQPIVAFNVDQPVSGTDVSSVLQSVSPKPVTNISTPEGPGPRTIQVLLIQNPTGKSPPGSSPGVKNESGKGVSKNTDTSPPHGPLTDYLSAGNIPVDKSLMNLIQNAAGQNVPVDGSSHKADGRHQRLSSGRSQQTGTISHVKKDTVVKVSFLNKSNPATSIMNTPSTGPKKGEERVNTGRKNRQKSDDSDDSGKEDSANQERVDRIENRPITRLSPEDRNDTTSVGSIHNVSRCGMEESSLLDSLAPPEKMVVRVQIDSSQIIMEGDQKRWKCSLCPKSYTTKHNLVIHILDHNKIKPHCCQICGKFFKQLSHLHTHALTHSNIKPHSCEFCKKSFTQISHLRRHLTTHMDMDLRPHQCDLCGRGFAFPSELRQHKEKHTRKSDVKCDDCGDDFNSERTLKKHKLEHKHNPEDLTCKECQKVFQYPSQLKEHMVKHSGLRPHICGECGMDFMKEHHLKAHQFTHTGLKPFTCKICGKSFNQKANLNRHQLIHREEKLYECKECHRRFSQPQTLKAHMVTHADKKPFQCRICAKDFSRYHNLQGHMHIHDDSKPFICFCGSSFTLKGNLNRHKKVKHGLDDSTECTEEDAANFLLQMSEKNLRAPETEKERTQEKEEKKEDLQSDDGDNGGEVENDYDDDDDDDEDVSSHYDDDLDEDYSLDSSNRSTEEEKSSNGQPDDTNDPDFEPRRKKRKSVPVKKMNVSD